MKIQSGDVLATLADLVSINSINPAYVTADQKKMLQSISNVSSNSEG